MAPRDTRSEAVADVTNPEEHLTQADQQNTVDFDEKRLAEASITGCSESFEELYAHYFPKVRGFVLRKTGNPALAEDIAQEAFARAFERIGEFGGPKHFGGWVGTIAANLCTDHFRRKRNTEVSLDTDNDRGPAYEVDPIRNIQRQDTSKLVRLALERLDPRQREALLLHEVKGMTCAAVGDHLGISEVAAESLLARARRRLRKEITAKAAPADLFGVGGIGLVPALVRAWRRAREGFSHRVGSVQAAAGRAVDSSGFNLLPGVDGAKALIVVMGTALTIQVASAAAPPVAQVDPVDASVASAAPADTASATTLIAADGDHSNLRGGDDVRLPVSGYVDKDSGAAGFTAESSVDVPAPSGSESYTSLDVELDGHLRPREGLADLNARIVVREDDGAVLLDTGQQNISTQ